MRLPVEGWDNGAGRGDDVVREAVIRVERRVRGRAGAGWRDKVKHGRRFHEAERRRADNSFNLLPEAKTGENDEERDKGNYL